MTAGDCKTSLGLLLTTTSSQLITGIVLVQEDDVLESICGLLSFFLQMHILAFEPCQA